MAIVNSNLAPLLKEGSNVTLTQDGQVITIASSGGGGGTPGGSDTQVQFNDGGSFGGDAGLTYDKTNNVLDLESIDFATTPTATDATGRLHWDNDEGSLVLTLKGGNLTIPIGQEVTTLVYNAEATTLNKGEVVYAFGASGQRVSVKRAINTGDSTSAQTLGVVAESIASGAEGFVMVQGMVRGIDTSAYTQGDAIYLGSSAGTFTKTKPYAPNHLVYIGFVVKINASSGEIFVKAQNGYEMDELHNVSAQSPSNNDILAYNTSTSLWEKKQLSAISGITGTGTTNYLPKFTGTSTIGNSTIQDLTTGVLVSPSVTAASAIARGLYHTPSLTAAANGDTLVGIDINPTFTNGAFTGVSNWAIRTGTSGEVLFQGGNGVYVTGNNSGIWGNTTRTRGLYFNSSGDVIVRTNNIDNRLVVSNGGNTLIGTATDSGFKLDVNGTTRIQGNLNISTGGATITGVVTSTNDFPTFRAFSSSASASTGYQMWVNNGSGNNASFLAYGNTTGGGLGGNAGFGSSTSIVIYGSSAIADGQTTTIKLRPGGYNTTADALVAYKNSVSIGTTNTPVASATLDVVSTTGGFLPPRMTTTQRNAITSPATGLIVYDTTNNVNSVYNATAWQNFVTTSNFDGLDISFGTTTGTKIGTATTQKIGFFNATPVVQPSAVTTSQGIADALSSLGLLASSSITTTPDVGGKLYLFNSY